MMMSKGSSMAEKTKQMQKDGGAPMMAPVSAPGLPGLGQRMLGSRSQSGGSVAVVDDDDDSDGPRTGRIGIAPSVGGSKTMAVPYQSKGTSKRQTPKGATTPVLDIEFDTGGAISPMPIDRVDDHVFIGNRIGAEELAYLKNNGITHIINTANELPNFHEASTGIRYMKLTLNDDPRPSVENLLKMLEPTYAFISHAVSSNPKARVFVHCAAGISRSASIVIYYLMKKNSIGFETALMRLKGKRQWVNPNPWYCSQLRDAQTIIENESGKLL